MSDPARCARLFTLACFVVATLGAFAAAQDFDLVIENGRVIDPESGLDGVRNVGIRGARIVAIDSKPLRGKRRIDAKGLVVAPGFIDLHRHGQNAENYRYAALDGVTSVFELEVGTANIDQWYRERATTMRDLFHGENERQSRLTSHFTLLAPLRFHLERIIQCRAD